MYYYKVEEDIVKKFEIEFNLEEMKKLRSEIIEKCSYITHESKEKTMCNCSNFTDIREYMGNEHIKLLKYEKVGSYTIEDFYGDFVYNEYKIEYLYYTFPKLVDLIDKLIEGDTKVISEIFNPSFDEPISKQDIILKEQQEVIEILNKRNNGDIKKELEKLNEIEQKLEECKKEQELNKNRIPVNEYYLKAQSLIILKNICTIKQQDLLNIFEFFEEDVDKVKQYAKR